MQRLNASLVRCRLCPRLARWREAVGRAKRKAFRGWTYWARPVPGFGDPRARILALGLAPGAHGSNRTGRMFTGDASGDFLFRALHATGFSNRSRAVRREDGLRLRNLYITAAARCAPPQNRPTPKELAACGRQWLDAELALLPRVQVVVPMGRVALDAYVAHLRRRGLDWRPRPQFAHGACWRAPDGRWVVVSYHPSRQNTHTRKLTPRMLRAVFRLARRLALDTARRPVGGRAKPAADRL